MTATTPAPELYTASMSVMGRNALSSSPPTDLSRFESLPAELRNRIYRLITGDGQLVPAVTLVTDEATGIKKYKPVIPGLAATNRNISHEVLGIHYSESTFTFNATPDFNASRRAISAWWDNLEHRYRQEVKSVAARFFITEQWENQEGVIIGAIDHQGHATYSVSASLTPLCSCGIFWESNTQGGNAGGPRLAAEICCTRMYADYHALPVGCDKLPAGRAPGSCWRCGKLWSPRKFMAPWAWERDGVVYALFCRPRGWHLEPLPWT